MERRKFIKAVGSVSGGIALAGCGGNTDGGETTDGGTTTSAETTDGETTTSAETTTGGNETTAENGTAGNETAGTTDADLPDIDGEIGDSPEGLEVSNRELYETNGEVGLRGTVENTGEQAYESVEAEVTLQDDQGEILYEFIDETEEAQTAGLPPGESWQFDVVFEEAQMSEVTDYTITLDGDVAQTTGDEGNLSGGNATTGNATAN